MRVHFSIWFLRALASRIGRVDFSLAVEEKSQCGTVIDSRTRLKGDIKF